MSLPDRSLRPSGSAESQKYPQKKCTNLHGTQTTLSFSFHCNWGKMQDFSRLHTAFFRPGPAQGYVPKWECYVPNLIKCASDHESRPIWHTDQNFCVPFETYVPWHTFWPKKNADCTYLAWPFSRICSLSLLGMSLSAQPCPASSEYVFHDSLSVFRWKEMQLQFSFILLKGC